MGASGMSLGHNGFSTSRRPQAFNRAAGGPFISPAGDAAEAADATRDNEGASGCVETPQGQSGFVSDHLVHGKSPAGIAIGTRLKRGYMYEWVGRLPSIVSAGSHVCAPWPLGESALAMNMTCVK